MLYFIPEYLFTVRCKIMLNLLDDTVDHFDQTRNKPLRFVLESVFLCENMVIL